MKPRYGVKRIASKQTAFLLIGLFAIMVPFPILKNSLENLSGYYFNEDGIYKYWRK